MVPLALAVGALSISGCASVTPQLREEWFVGAAPLPTLVPRGQALARAEQVAAQRPGDFALQGLGRSMEPFYLPGTALVVHPTAMHMLKRGMAVVYTNARGEYVAHMLLERTEAGWTAIGLNNQAPDATLVTARNLVGVVRHAFASADTPFRPDIAARLTPPLPTEPAGRVVAVLR